MATLIPSLCTQDITRKISKLIEHKSFAWFKKAPKGAFIFLLNFMIGSHVYGLESTEGYFFSAKLYDLKINERSVEISWTLKI